MGFLNKTLLNRYFGIYKKCAARFILRVLICVKRSYIRLDFNFTLFSLFFNLFF